NICAETDSAGVNPGVLVLGTLPYEQRLRQGRIFSYPDTKSQRAGPNHYQRPINRPKKHDTSNKRYGQMPYKQQSSSINHEPNS
ncbi:catalase, partial [Listeria monocytogenes]|uniref:catalase n=1 Tax=Listeria monocytogenes TaxID=1639 RepID=UPI000E6D38E2